MAIEFQLECSASVVDTLAALKKHAPEWRESTFPEALRDGGVLGIQMRGRLSRFSLRYDGRAARFRSNSCDPREFELTATVIAKSNEACTVRGKCGRIYIVPAITGLTVVGALCVIQNQPFAASLFFTSAIIFFLVRQRLDQNVTRGSDPAARYLVERVEHVIADLNAQRSPTR